MTSLVTIAAVLGFGALCLAAIIYLAIRKGRADVTIDTLATSQIAADKAAEARDSVARLSDDDARKLLAQWERGPMLGDAADTSKPR